MSRRGDKGKWAVVTIAILLIIATLVTGICTNWFTEKNKFCLFGHDYGDDGKCIRCGTDKPVDEQPDEPQAFVSESYRVYASANSLNTNNDNVALMSAEDWGLETVSTWASGSNYQENNTQDIVGIEELPLNSSLNDYVCITTFGMLRPTRKIITIDAPFFSALSIGSGVPVSNPEHTSYHVCYFRVGGTDGWKEFTVNNDNSTYADKEVTVKLLDLKGKGQYKVCLVKHNAQSNVIEERSEIFIVNFNVQELPPEPTKVGYTFTGWYTYVACTNKYTEQYITGDITLYAGFRAHTYSIKFNANSGSGNMSNLPMTYDQSKAITANAFTKEHYAFKGWATEPNGAVVYSNSQSVKNLTATDNGVVELFAVWERSEVKVDFLAEGKITTTWVAIGTKATLPESPTKEGHLFVGWFFEDGTEYVDQDLTEDTTLTAKFSIIQCTVTFIVDGEVYAMYVCDWGTKLSEVLNANDVNAALLKVEGEYSRNF